MSTFRKCAAIGALAALPLTGAFGADLAGGYKDGVAGNYWVVTVGGYGALQPDFPGSRDYSVGFRPIIDVRKAGEPERLSLPNDAVSISLYQNGPFRAGLAGDYLTDRNHSDSGAIRGLHDINYSIELGAFAEYWAAPNVRTRVELLQGVTGHDGFIANFSADYVYKPDYRWQFTVGPRLSVVNTQFESTYFSVNSIEMARSGLPVFHASGGVHSAGVDATARYNVSDRFSVRGFAEWQRLLGDAADSPIVRLRGSEDQFQLGVGAAYSFGVPRQ
jgi:outer membrane protein